MSLGDKITSASDLLARLGELLGCDLTHGEAALLRHDRKLERKTVVMIDEGQNLFLGHRGGFEAFRMLTSLLSCRTENTYWCMAFNRYSWTYLNAVTGGSEYFRAVRRLDAWTDEELKRLILTRHERSSFVLEYDPVIFATERSVDVNGTRYVQDRFFELLWEQSRGNPRAAIVLWLSSLKVVGRRRLRVGLPSTSPAKPLAGLTDDELFVIAAIIRHENLTPGEARRVTSLGDGIVRHAFRIGIERGFIERSPGGRYRVSPLWQWSLTQQLTSKNFVYE